MALIAELREKYLNQTLTPTQHVLNEIERLKHIDSKINAVVTLLPFDDIIEQANASTKRYANGTSLGPFDGIPITTKDTTSLAMKNLRINKGSKIYSFSRVMVVS